MRAVATDVRTSPNWPLAASRPKVYEVVVEGCKRDGCTTGGLEALPPQSVSVCVLITTHHRMLIRWYLHLHVFKFSLNEALQTMTIVGCIV